MQKLDVFVPDILLECEGCSNLVAKNFIKSVIQDFCENTHAYIVNLDTLFIFSGIRQYELSAPSNSIIIGIESVDRDNNAFRNYTYDHVTFELDSVPNEDFQLKIKAAIKPTPNVTEVEDRFYNIYSAAIVAGVKARLMMQPAKPWSNPSLGMKYQADYENYVSKAKISINKSASKQKDLSVQMRPFV